MLIDSFAWIEYFMGTEMGVEVKQVVESDVQLYTSPIVIAEIYSKSLRTDGRAEERRNFIVKRCAVIPIDEEIAVEAAKIHAEAKKTMEDFGLADAFVLASARYKNVRVLTGDPHFEDFSESIML
uniref:tRNA(fMet)-specific endonuclease VapC n=1 Tax=Candidatus Methanophagaceae archaeon ANME-1 ERB6 TaxID=2759912 RepID=A0A7G9YY38_9EURY|nr:tRNA(fMet)-specific endonuclease VapC [Methanosarcinales archaeon ANME-1 ERB6]